MQAADPTSSSNRIESLIADLSEKLRALPPDLQAQVVSDPAVIGDLLFSQAQPAGQHPSSLTESFNLAESIDDGFFEVDRDWSFTYINRRAAQNVALQPADLIGRNLWETFPSLAGTASEQYYHQVMAQREPVDFEMPGTITQRWYNIRVYPSHRGIAIFWIDITERKQMEEALRASENKFVTFFNRAAFPATVSRLPEGKLVEVNDAWVNTFGFSREEALGRTSLALGINPDQGMRADIIAKLLETGSAHDIEMNLQTKSGERRDFLVNMDIVDVDGERYILNTTQDITDRTRAEAALRQREALLRAQANELQAIMDATPAIIWITRDAEARQLTGNAYSYEFLQLDMG